MSAPTDFHRKIKEIKESRGITNVTMGKLLGVGDEHYYVLEANKSGIVMYAEPIIQFLIPIDDPDRETKLKELRGLDGYNADIEHVLDVVTGLKVPDRHPFGSYFSDLRTARNIPVAKIAPIIGHAEHTVGDISANLTRLNDIHLALCCIEQVFQIPRDPGDKTGFSAVKKFYDEAQEAEKLLDVYRPQLGKAHFAHRRFNGMGNSYTELSLSVTAGIAKLAGVGTEAVSSISAIENGKPDFSLAMACGMVDVFNFMRRNASTAGVTVAPLPNDILVAMRQKLQTPVDPANLSLVEFVEVGMALAERHPTLVKQYTVAHPEAIRFSDDMRTIRDFLGILDAGISKESSLTASAIRARKTPLPEQDQRAIFDAFNIEPHADFAVMAARFHDLARDIRQVSDFHQTHLNETYKKVMKAADIKAAAYWKQTGAVLGKTTYKRPNEVRKIIECINLEDRDMAFKIQGLLKKGEDGGNLGTAEQEWIARIVSTPGTKGQTPPEVVFYDSAVKVETPEFGTAWAAMRPIMDRAYRYRDNYHDKAIRPLERF